MASHKLAYITASIAKRFMTGTSADKLIAGNLSACAEIAEERLELDGYLLPDPDDMFIGDKHTERGHILESDNIAKASERLGVDMHGFQEVFSHDIERWSCTVDALIGDDAIYEAKAPTRKNQRGYLLSPGSLSKQYKDQLQFQLLITGRRTAYIGAYCPLYLSDSCLLIETVHVDEKWRKFAATRLPKCEEEIERVYNALLEPNKQLSI